MSVFLSDPKLVNNKTVENFWNRLQIRIKIKFIELFI